LTSACACSAVSALDGLPSRPAGVCTSAATLRATMSSAWACRIARTRQLRAICSDRVDSSPFSPASADRTSVAVSLRSCRAPILSVSAVQRESSL
jgi:hypothetical protein